MAGRRNSSSWQHQMKVTNYNQEKVCTYCDTTSAVVYMPSTTSTEVQNVDTYSCRISVLRITAQ